MAVSNTPGPKNKNTTMREKYLYRFCALIGKYTPFYPAHAPGAQQVVLTFFLWSLLSTLVTPLTRVLNIFGTTLLGAALDLKWWGGEHIVFIVANVLTGTTGPDPTFINSTYTSYSQTLNTHPDRDGFLIGGDSFLAKLATLDFAFGLHATFGLFWLCVSSWQIYNNYGATKGKFLEGGLCTFAFCMHMLCATNAIRSNLLRHDFVAWFALLTDIMSSCYYFYQGRKANTPLEDRNYWMIRGYFRSLEGSGTIRLSVFIESLCGVGSFPHQSLDGACVGDCNFYYVLRLMRMRLVSSWILGHFVRGDEGPGHFVRVRGDGGGLVKEEVDAYYSKYNGLRVLEVLVFPWIIPRLIAWNQTKLHDAVQYGITAMLLFGYHLTGLWEHGDAPSKRKQKQQ